MNKNDWMRKEIAVWRSEGVIDAPLAEVLSKRYAATSARLSWAALLAGVFGALLIGLGVIALLAVNWDFIGRGGRAAIALTPVVCCGFLAGLAVWKNWRALSFWEALGIFWCLATSAAACLVAQTYQLGGTVPGLILFVALLTLPIVWVTRTVVGMALWPIWVVAWGVTIVDVEGKSWGTLVCAFGLLALSIPALVDFVRRDLPRAARVTGEWFSGLVYGIGVPVVILVVMPRLAGIGLSKRGYFAFWGCALIVGLVGAFCRISSWPLVATLIAAVTAFVLSFTSSSWYLPSLVLACASMVWGVRKRHLGYTNIGAVLFLWLVLVKFFASEVDLTLKGLVLIISGTVLVALNVVMVKLRKGGAVHAK